MLWLYWIHVVNAIVFILLLLFPFIVRRQDQRQPQEMIHKLRPWKLVFYLAHLGLVVALITGLLMKPDFASFWFWLVMAVYVLIGAMLGLAAKYLRLALQAAEQQGTALQQLTKLRRFSEILAFSIIVMLLLMSYPL